MAASQKYGPAPALSRPDSERDSAQPTRPCRFAVVLWDADTAVEQFGAGAQFGALHASVTLVLDDDRSLRLCPDGATRAAAKFLNVPGTPEPTDLVHNSDVVRPS